MLMPEESRDISGDRVNEAVFVLHMIFVLTMLP